MNRIPALAMLCLSLQVQPRAVHSADWHRAGAPGGEMAAGGFRMRGAGGQAEAGVVEGGGYRLTGGFWHAVAVGFAEAAVPQVAELTPSPRSGAPGSLVRVRGIFLPAGSAGVRAYWEQAGVLRVVGRGRSGADGIFDLQLTVPADVEPGPARVAVVAEGGSPEDIASAAFDVVAPAPGRIAGVVRDAAGQGVGPGFAVRLLGQDGLALATTFTDAAGAFLFASAPPGTRSVQVMTTGYPPALVVVNPGQSQGLQIDPADLASPKWPPVMLVSAGAVALPGGSYPGKDPVQVGDWSDDPMARLVSLKGKGLAPLKVRFWAEVQRVLLPADANLIVAFELQKGGQPVAPLVVTNVPAIVYPAGKLNVPAFTADFNSLELTPGKLTLVIRAFTSFLLLVEEVGRWEFPVEVVDLGSRWYAGNVRNPALSVTKQDFFQLRYEFSGALPNLPGVGTPLFNEPLDLKFAKVQNRFDLGIALKERFFTGGAWEGTAKAKAALTLFSVDVLNESRNLVRSGSSLKGSTYSFQDPWTVPLFDPICVPIFGPTLPKKIDLCGMKFGGSLGVSACVGGIVVLTAHTQPDLRLTAKVTPGLDVALPIGADLELGICEAVAKIEPKVNVAAPIVLDPAHSPPVYWDGLCVTLSGKATAELSCCGLGVDKSVNLFDPISVPNGCAAPGRAFGLMAGEDDLLAAPPRNAAIAYSPAGHAVAVWENFEPAAGGLERTAPVVSIFNGTTWSAPRTIAGPRFAGWEPQVGFLNDQTAAVSWVIPGTGRFPGGVALAAPGPHNLCDSLGDVIEFGCTILEGAATVVKVICLGFCASPAENGGEAALMALPEESPDPVVIGGGPVWNLRPVLATNPGNGDAVVIWLREQEPIPGRQQTLALYYSRLAAGAWSAPQRVDPVSNFFDLQPSLRFDRQGRPAVVWVRDADADLDTPADRTLVFSRLDGAAWSTPETLASLPRAPWTPSLDFDRNNLPVVAFVVPAMNPVTGELLGGDGTLSTLHIARRAATGWSARPVGDGTLAERPVVRVNSENHALVFFRGFGGAGRMSPLGEIASAVANLAEAEPRWTTAPIAADRRMNWQVAAELNPTNGVPLVFWETRDPANRGAEPELRGSAEPWAVDLALAGAGLTFSEPNPLPGRAVEVTARMANLGLRPLGAVAVRVDFYDREPGLGIVPFATRTVRGPLGFGEELSVTASYTPTDRTWRTMRVVVDAGDVVPESDETNNHVDTPWGGLAAPTDVSAAPHERTGAVRLGWTSPVDDGSVRHWIWRTQLRTGERELVGATTLTEFTDATVVPGEDYIYRLVSVDAGGVRSLDGAAAAAATALVPVADRPDPESLRLNVVPHGDRVTLTWSGLPAVQLQAADALAGAGTRWLSVADGVERFGGVAQITLPAVQGQRFFRLVVP